MAKGLDCGTSYYITATENSIKKQRNVFLTVDGDEDSSDEYLKKRRDAVSKAVKSTKEGLDAKPVKRLKDIGNMTGIPALGDMIRKK